MTIQPRKKVLYLITKSNWGEKVYRHFLKTLPSIFVENTDKVYRVCKTQQSRPITNSQIS